MKEIIDLSDDESTSSKEIASLRKNLGLNDGDAPITSKRKRNEKEVPLETIKKEDAIAPIVDDTVNETNKVKFSIGTLHVTAHDQSTVNIQGTSNSRTIKNINKNEKKNDTNHFNEFIKVPSIDFNFRIKRKINTATNIDIIHNNDNVGAMNNGITISIVCGDNNINVDFNFGMTNATNNKATYK